MTNRHDQTIRIVALKEFTEDEIAAAKDSKFAEEMRIYNMRAMRGDFD